MALTDGLVALWHMNNDWTDASGNGNNGTATGATFSASSKLGSHAGSFDGADDRVDIANESQFDFDYNSTFSGGGWVYPDVLASDAFISKWSRPSDAILGWDFTDSSSGQIQLALRKTSTSNSLRVVTTVGYVISAAAWNHVFFTYDGSGVGAGVKLYVNGVLAVVSITDDTLSSNSILNNAPVLLGANRASDTPTYGNLYDGLMDEMGVWNRVVTPNEVARLYNGGEGVEIVSGLGGIGRYMRGINRGMVAGGLT